MTSTQGSAKMRLVLLGLALAVGVGLWLWLRHPVVPIDPSVPKPLVVRQSTSFDRSPAPVAQPKTPSGPAAAIPDPIIDEIVVEKSEVCQGEENLVSIRAHTVDGSDAYLRYGVDGELGASVSVRSYLEADGKQPSHVVQVYGRGMTYARVDRPLFKVKDCVVPVSVDIESHLELNSTRAFQLVAKVGRPRLGQAVEWKPIRYRWDFGDGATAVTTTPVASHEFAETLQTTMTTDYLVRVEVEEEKGAKAQGRASLSLLNSAFQAFVGKHLVMLYARLNPRFPHLDSDGKVRERVQLYHHRADDVFIESVERVSRGPDGKEHSQKLEPIAVFGAETIPPGLEGLAFDLVLDAGNDRDFRMDRYVVNGTTQDGYHATGEFSIMKPSPEPTVDDEPVRDPVLMAKILAARRILGQQFVSQGDIARLDREGQFKDLQVDPAAADRARARPPAPSTKPHPPVRVEPE